MNLTLLEEKFNEAKDKYELKLNDKFTSSLKHSYSGGPSQNTDLNYLLSLCYLIVDYLDNNQLYYSPEEEEFIHSSDPIFYNLDSHIASQKVRQQIINKSEELLQYVESFDSKDSTILEGNLSHFRSFLITKERKVLEEFIIQLKEISQSYNNNNKFSAFEKSSKNMTLTRAHRMKDPKAKRELEYPQENFLISFITYFSLNIFSIDNNQSIPRAFIRSLYQYISPYKSNDLITDNKDGRSKYDYWITNYEKIVRTDYGKGFLDPLIN